MTVGWVVYVLAVSLLVTLATHGAASALRLQGRPLRWTWAGGLALTAAVPLAPRLLAALPSPAAGTGWGLAERGRGAAAVLLDPGAGAPGAPPAPGDPLAEALATPLPGPVVTAGAVAWAVASAALVALLVGGWLRLRFRLRRCPRARVAGEPVRVSRETGPAAAGILRPVVVVPASLLRRPDREQRMAVAHEREHVRRRDPALIAFGRLGVALAPWNPCLWWLFRRLRLAVELDCDRRVLGRGHSRREYGRLLLDVTAPRPVGLLHPAATLRESSNHLEARIRAMTDPTPSFPRLRTILLLGASIGLLAAACETPTPPAADGGDEEVAAAGERSSAEAARADAGLDLGAAAPGGPDDAPHWIPRDVDPRPKNDREIARLLREHYPDDLRERAVTGEVSVWLFIDDGGAVEDARILEPSDRKAFNEAALEVARRMRFEPAVRDGEPVGVWVARTLRFEPGAGNEGRMAVGPPPDSVSELEVTDITVHPSGVPTLDMRPEVLPANEPETPDRGPDIRIYESTTAEPTDDPLILVDGERVRAPGARTGGPGEGSSRHPISDLHPEDIESIEVIKGEEAVSRYGDAAREGVILITTRDGRGVSG